MIEIDQPQENFSRNLNYEPQPRLMQIMLQWIRGLPQEPTNIVDLAAGYGIEAQELTRQGIACICQDASAAMIENAVIPIQYGQVEALNYPMAAFRGALLKDTLIFLSPQQRSMMMCGLKRILSPQGSLLVVSETAPLYIIQYFNQLGDSDYCRYPDFTSMKEKYLQLIAEGSIIKRLIYQTQPTQLMELARQHGFTYQSIVSYTANDTLVAENRWTKNPGFIAQLTKIS